MNNIKIETLSSVHIGNGSFLQKGSDFIVDGNSVYVLSMDKLGALMGADPAIIQQWTEAINKGESESFIKSRMKDVPYIQFAKRRIDSIANFNQTNGTLKECMHDGFGRPYIPGSSIKGAIRTVVMSTIAREQIGEKLKRENKEKWIKIIKEMEKKLLHFDTGEKSKKKDSPSNDLFRYFSTGDAYFDKGVEIAINQMNLNITRNDSLLDRRKQQVVEVIKKGVSSQFRMKVADEFYQKTDIHDLQHLFNLINNHTYNLLCDEIEFWDKGEGANYKGKDQYLDRLEDILDVIDACQPNECVIRIGQASGWRFITGAWLEEIDPIFFKKVITPLCRPKNKEHYAQYPFPKSRRIDSDSNVLGFVKLIIN